MVEDPETVVVTSFDKSDQVVARLSQETLFGLDCEWDMKHAKGSVEKPDLLQIATTDGFCALFRLNIMKEVPRGVRELLEDTNYVKFGVGINEDTKKLSEFFGVTTRSVVDVRHIADELGVDPRGLSHLTECVLGIPCRKYSYTSRFHQWSGRLSPEQIRYAAADAVNAVRIYDLLRRRWVSSRWGDECKGWDEATYHRATRDLWRKYVGKAFDYNFSRFSTKEIVECMLSLSSLSKGGNT